jgi:3-hydroxyacyl-CoA dehydrogenase
MVDVAVLGCGLIGASWAALFAAAGYEVRAWDPSAATRESFVGKVHHAREQLAALGLSSDRGVRVCEDFEDAVANAAWIQENAPEKLDLKLQLYRRLQSVMAPDAVLATSTSSFSWSQLASDLGYADRFVVAHPFNPPHLIPLVELFCPNPQTLQRAVALFRSTQRVPVCLKREAVGHIGNRLASALWREAVNIVAEGIAEVADVDNVLIHGPGLRWSIVGTHMGYHLGGGDGGIDHYLRHLGPSQERRWESLGQPKLTPEVCEKIAAGVHAEAAGRSIAELEALRDAQLIEVLRVRRAHRSAAALDTEESPVKPQEEIAALLEKYFAGLYYGDVELLRSVFHPQAQLFGDVRGAPYQNSLEGFLGAVAGRESPHQRGEEFQMQAVGVEVMNQIAYVKARCPMLGFNYHDYLALLHEDHRWLITNKLFTHAAD